MTPTTSAGHRPRALPRFAAALLAAVLLGGFPALALVGEGADEGVQPMIVPNYTVVPAAGLAAAVRADRDYVTGMRAHHAGALTMSDEYLADPEARSPALRELAAAIRHNQRFEITLLDEVGRRLDQAPLMFGGLAVQPASTESPGLATRDRFARAPIPGPLTPFAPPGGAVGARDVQFAKAMTIHHQGALDMAGAYQANPDARNTFLGLLNVDIITDQTQEIGLMRRAVTAYPGDAAAVPVPASMIHGMEGMSHGGHGAHATGAAAPPSSVADPHAGHGGAPVPAPAGRAAPRRPAPAHHAH